METIRTTHSIADSICLSIDTPVGRIFHTGDFKIDYTPVDGEPIDLSKLAELGSKGVLLMMSDSTNATRPGFTESEKKVGDTLESICAQDTKNCGQCGEVWKKGCILRKEYGKCRWACHSSRIS